MRSNIFIQFPNLTEKFKKDFANLWLLKKEQLNQLIPFVPKYFKSESRSETKTIIDNAVMKIKADSTLIISSITILDYVYDNWDPFFDTPETVIKDLIELNLLPSPRRKAAERFFKKFLSVVQRDNERRVKKSFQGTMLSTFSSVESIIDYRAVFSNPYGSSRRYTLKNYKPKLLTHIPIIILSFDTHGLEHEKFIFQCTEMELDRIIERLSIVKKELRASKIKSNKKG